jgi:hypothetical protein
MPQILRHTRGVTLVDEEVLIRLSPAGMAARTAGPFFAERVLIVGS